MLICIFHKVFELLTSSLLRKGTKNKLSSGGVPVTATMSSRTPQHVLKYPDSYSVSNIFDPYLSCSPAHPRVFYSKHKRNARYLPGFALDAKIHENE